MTSHQKKKITEALYIADTQPYSTQENLMRYAVHKERFEERLEIARKWQELKRYTEEERAQIISDSKSRSGDRQKILARWADLKVWRRAERAILLLAWRENLARGV